MDESQGTGKVSLGLSVIVRVTLKDGTYHEVKDPMLGLASFRLNSIGHWIWSH